MRRLAPDAVEFDFPELATLTDSQINSEMVDRVIEAAPALADATTAISKPLVMLSCILYRPESCAEHRIYADTNAAAVLFDLAEDKDAGQSRGVDPYRLTSVVPSAVPALLARLVGLGPRRQTRQPQEIEYELGKDMLSRDELLRQSALLELRANWGWQAQIHNHEDGVRTLQAIDGSEGLALMKSDDDVWYVEPTTPTEVFDIFTTVYN